MSNARFSGGVPDIQKVRQVYDLFESGLTRRQISEVVGLNKDTVGRYIANPGKYDPYLDEVAIVRVLDGDAEVYDNLTIFEYFEVLDRVSALAALLPPDEWLDFRHGLQGRLGDRRYYNIERRIHERKAKIQATA